MCLRRAVLQIPAKSSAPPRLPFYKNRFLPTPSQSTLPQLLISPHFNSFRTNVYKKPGGSGAAAKPKGCKLVTRHMPRLRTRRNSRNPNPLIRLLTLPVTHGGGGAGATVQPHSSSSPLTQQAPQHSISCPFLFSSFSVPSVTSALKPPFHPAEISAHSRKAIPATSSLSLFTTHHPLLTLSSSFQGKIYPFKSRSHHV